MPIYIPSGGGSGSSTTPVIYSSNVALDNTYVMSQTNAVSGMSFTPDYTRLKPFGSSYIRVIANGVSAPTFPGFYEHGSSSGYDNTNNIINNIMMWYDGLSFWYSISQAANAVAVSAPVIQSATVSETTPNIITLLYSGTLDAIGIPNTSAYSLTSAIPEAISQISISGAAAILTTTRDVSGNESIKLNYTLNPMGANIRSSYGNVNASSLNLYTVDTSFGMQIVRFFAKTSGFSESGDSNNGWVYTSITTGTNMFATTFAASASVRLPAYGDGSVFTTSTWPACGNGYIATIVSLKSANTLVGYADASSICGIYSTLTTYKAITKGTGGQAIDNLGYLNASGDIIRIRRQIPNIYAEVSKNGGTSYTTIHTWAASGDASHNVGIANITGALYPSIAGDYGHIIGPVKARGMI